MLSVTTLIFISSVSSAFGFMSFGNTWVRHCRAGHTRAIRNTDCDELGLRGMRSCLMSTHDRTVAALIRRCPNHLPREEAFDEYARRLYQANLPRAFRAYISDRRCANLSSSTLRQLLDSFVNNNAVPFVRAVMQHCVVGEDVWRRFAQQAQMQGRNELLVTLRAGPGSGSGSGGLGKVGSDQGKSWGMSYSIKRDVHTLPSGEKFVVAKQETSRDPGQLGQSSQPGQFGQPGQPGQPGLPPTPEATGTNAGIQASSTAVVGQYMQATSQQVASNVAILSQLTRDTAKTFGLLSDGCNGLTEGHFKQPSVSPSVIKQLPLHCFLRIPPPAFAGLSPAMISAIPWWPFVTRDQVRYISTGSAIRALPFDQLGKGRQKDSEDREHPCWTITRDQLRSIRKSRSVLREYNRRCIRSGAPASVILSPISLFMGVAISVLVLAI